MPIPSIIEEPQLDDASTSSGDLYVVTVYDNDHNTVEQVMNILILATGCTFEEAEMETWEIHNLGKSVVHHGSKEECQTAAAIISEIGIKVTVTQE
jgi:ATP-dependent Clp protease adapter protein ClpS